MIGIYARVSTHMQDIDAQLFPLIAYCENRGWDYVIYKDENTSGKTNDRPSYKKLLDDASSVNHYFLTSSQYLL